MSSNRKEPPTNQNEPPTIKAGPPTNQSEPPTSQAGPPTNQNEPPTIKAGPPNSQDDHPTNVVGLSTIKDVRPTNKAGLPTSQENSVIRQATSSNPDGPSLEGEIPSHKEKPKLSQTSSTKEQKSSTKEQKGSAEDECNLGCGQEEMSSKKQFSSKKDKGSSEVPPTRQLHSCPVPWRCGSKDAPVQLNPRGCTEPYHRTILSILNRVCEEKWPILVKQSRELLMPPVGADDKLMYDAVTYRNIREDYVAMLIEKANDEECFLKTYCMLIKSLGDEIDKKTQEWERDNKIQQLQLVQDCPKLYLGVTEQCVNQFKHLYGKLQLMHCMPQHSFSGDKEILLRRRLVNHLDLMIMLHINAVIPLMVLQQVMDALSVFATYIRNSMPPHHPPSASPILPANLHVGDPVNRPDPANDEMANPANNDMVNPANNEMVNPANNEMVNPANNEMVNPANNEMVNPANITCDGGVLNDLYEFLLDYHRDGFNNNVDDGNDESLSVLSMQSSIHGVNIVSLSLELLGTYLHKLGHLNEMHNALLNSDVLCHALISAVTLNSFMLRRNCVLLSTRQVFIVRRTFDFMSRGWRNESKVPHRCG